MKLRLQENPKEWRKNALLTAGGVAMLSSLLRWRKIVPVSFWLAVLALALITGFVACLAPRWFRGYYRFSHRLGFHLARAVGFVVLGAIFLFIITPMGLVLRACGQDPLRIKPRGQAETYWHPANKSSPLDRLF